LPLSIRNHAGKKKDTKKDALEVKWPWTLMPIECAGEWIKEIKKGLKVTTLKTKDVSPLAHDKHRNLIVLEIDHGDSYLIVKYAPDKRGGLLFKVERTLLDGQQLRSKIEHDHRDVVEKTKQKG
jgi:hypothetical protein